MRSAYHKILTDLTALRGLVDFILEKEITIDYYTKLLQFLYIPSYPGLYLFQFADAVDALRDLIRHRRVSFPYSQIILFPARLT